MEDFFLAEINNREKTSKALYKCIAVVDYADKTLLVLPGAGSGLSLCSFATVSTPIVLA